jgi:UDP-N-acetylglucosamine 2-epimerase (non-hydrolysing)
LPKVISLVGARPQFVKEAMIYKEVRRLSAWDHVLVHSGQHYDASMSAAFHKKSGSLHGHRQRIPRSHDGPRP